MSSSSPTDFNPARNPKASINEAFKCRGQNFSYFSTAFWRVATSAMEKSSKLCCGWVSWQFLEMLEPKAEPMPPTLLTMGNVSYIGKRYRKNLVFKTNPACQSHQSCFGGICGKKCLKLDNHHVAKCKWLEKSLAISRVPHINKNKENQHTWSTQLKSIGRLVDPQIPPPPVNHHKTPAKKIALPTNPSPEKTQKTCTCPFSIPSTHTIINLAVTVGWHTASGSPRGHHGRLSCRAVGSQGDSHMERWYSYSWLHVVSHIMVTFWQNIYWILTFLLENNPGKTLGWIPWKKHK